MWRHNPQTRGSRAARRGRDRRAAARARGVLLPARRRDDVRLAPTLDGGALMDVGCYCVSGVAARRGRAGERVARQAMTAERGRLALRRRAALRGRRARELRLRLRLPARDELEVVGDEGPLVLDDPWHCRSRGHRAERATARRGHRARADRLYRLELEDLSAAIRGERAPLLGRDDARRPGADDRGALPLGRRGPRGDPARCGLGMSAAMRVAIAGYGLRRRGLPRAARRRPRRAFIGRSAAVATSDPARAARARERTRASGRRARRHARRCRRLDLLVVATPNRHHVPLAPRRSRAGRRSSWTSRSRPTRVRGRARRRLRRGRRAVHGLSEPPLRRRLPHLRRCLAVGRARRGHALRVALRALPAGGRAPGRGASWRPRDEGGGLLLDLGAHLVDQAVALFGHPRRVYAEIAQRRPGAQVDDDTFVALEHPDGERSHLWMSRSRRPAGLAARQRDGRGLALDRASIRRSISSPPGMRLATTAGAAATRRASSTATAVSASRRSRTAPTSASTKASRLAARRGGRRPSTLATASRA